ncbi:MAG: Asp-tRNA(Asn)/Glu-tRNA(Gln) amidotransferase subunit GatB [Candidatus Saccharimonadales bacterium]
MTNQLPLRSTINPNYIVDIGIECHVQLKTNSKLFCGCSNDAREAEPNTLICPICLGMPGTLPVLNKAAVELAIRAGLALNAEIASDTKFDRKNYFYPDLPKGYQITQYDEPIVGQGEIAVHMSDSSFKVGITRAHLEEDAGKLTHPEGVDYSLVDLNRAGTPLLEIVSEPDIHSPAEAKAYTQELYMRMLYAGVSDVDLYHGNMRFDVNVSVRKKDSKTLGTRSETKNLNSFRSVEKAAEYEINRQIELLEKGEKIVQETRGYDDSTGKTISQRSKEEAMDYRYFKEPDLPPLQIAEQMKQAIAKNSPIMVGDIRAKLKEADLSQTIITAILNQPKLADLQQDVIATNSQYAKPVANWLSGEVLRIVGEEGFNWDKFQLDSDRLVALAQMVEVGDLSSTNAKIVLSAMITTDTPPEDIAKDKGLIQMSDTNQLGTIVDQVIAANPQAVKDVESGEAKAIGFLVGQVMKESKGQANPQMVQEMLKSKLK